MTEEDALGERRATPGYILKINQARSNLKRWSPLEWVTFWIVVPAVLLVVYSLPQAIKDRFFILNTQYPGRVGTWFLSSYTHSQLYPHLIGNLAFYLVVLLMIFLFENNKRRFRILAGWSFLVVPFISSFLTILLWSTFNGTVTGQGFSAIIGAFLAYAMFAFVTWGIGEEIQVFDRPESYPIPKIRLNVSKVLVMVILALIVVMGLQMGIFTDAGGSVSNGIAHFGGFITALVLLFVIDTRTETRRYFDTMMGIAIVIGIIWYISYLQNLIEIVKG